MGVDVYYTKEKESKQFEWLMQFSGSYLCWLHWIITASGEDPSRVGMAYPINNIRYVVLLPHGHPWEGTEDDRIYLTKEECIVLEKDLSWFIDEKQDGIDKCDYLKSKTQQFHKALKHTIKLGGFICIR